MKPKQLVQQWIQAFNQADPERLASFYADNAINHQAPEPPLHGKQAIKHFFIKEFALANMTCIVENLFEDGEWAILEWKDPSGLRGCGFFHIQNDKIITQRGYWDKLSFLRLNNLPLPTN
ncbi:SnoaL-like domain protein [Poriferisphaera corsica]|uniref:SnoaL-like domain protein n=1 Tax=Poriferisphaera corsica TaxID=2528020 RepID=A0A517YX99_9BACT|nr:nuclear transport factor 2 family protein [Poriferisphaera corsica]QDU34841.1 SnoaL-like domain protein [Poriferisphaera corsica]